MSDKKKDGISFGAIENSQEIQDSYNEQILKNANQQMVDLIKHATGTASKTKSAPRLAFSEDPKKHYNYAGIYKLKHNKLIPDQVIKQIRTQNSLVASILRARGNTISMMGHVRKDRFDVGVECEIKKEYKSFIKPEEAPKIQERIDRFVKILINCGLNDGLEEKDKMTLPEFLDIQTRNGLSFGRFSTEIVYRDNEQQTFHRFRPVDAATIFPTVKKGESAEGVRQSSLKWLETATGIKIDKSMFEQDEYSWVQAIDGSPIQAFTSKEMLVYNLFPSSDVEHNGYPITPLDTAINAVTTHMSIEIYNKLYFQNGRAAKGMLVINSDEIDQSVIEDIKQQFNASINNVNNSFRTPIFGVSKEDQVNWVSTMPQKKDGEFEFLYDQVTRNVLSAFNISPEELPGYGHLSRGTNQQALSEANNEYKLIAARDTGIRPLILKMQDFINEKLFPIIDPELSQLCNVNLSGFDAETRQQESTRLQQDAPLHYNYDQIMEEVEKEIVGPHMGGNVPFNERYKMTLDQYSNTSEILSFFYDDPGSIVDPILKYKRDQFWFQSMQLLQQANPEALQAYYATRKDSMSLLKLFLQDLLDEMDINEE